MVLIIIPLPTRLIPIYCSRIWAEIILDFSSSIMSTTILRNSADLKPKDMSDSKLDDEDSSSSSDEDIEPILKYKRLCNDVEIVLQKEAVSCVAFNSKIICIGTFWGLIHVFDHQGHRIPIQLSKAHTVAVNQISLDATGDFIASCADDGKAYVYGLYSIDNQLQFASKEPIYSIAIDPNFSKLGTNRRFVTGGDRLLLHEKSYLMSALRTTALQESIGFVQNLKWCGHFVTYAYRDNVRIYDIEERKIVGLIQWDQPKDGSTLDQYSCCLTWKNSTTLLIGWLHTIRICCIEKRHPVMREAPRFMINVVITMRVNYFICGICPLNVSKLVTLAYRKKCGAEASPPLLHFLESEDDKYVQLQSDILSLRSYRRYTCHEYHFAHFCNENKFIIACPKDVVVAVRYSVDERIDWLVSRNKFEKAMALASAKQEFLQRNTLLEVGQKYINYLLSRQEFDLAGQICSQVLGDDSDLWEKEAFKFARAGQLRAISQYLPGNSNPYIHKMGLQERVKRESPNVDIIQKRSLLGEDVRDGAQGLVIFWPNTKETSAETSDDLTHSKPYGEVLDFYIAVKYKGIFDYIKEKKLKKRLYGKLNAFLEVDPQQAVDVLVNGDRMNVDKVVAELQTNKFYQYLYLDALNVNVKHEARKYHNLLVKLYAEYCQAKLLPLLRRSRYYSLPKALSVCEEHSLHREAVHLLSRMGATKKALHVLLHKVDDIEMATLFCEKHNDLELWQDLIEHYKAKPDFIEYFLPRIDRYLDPRTLIRRADNRMPIGDLKNCLVNKLEKCRQRIIAEENCKNILVSEFNRTFGDFVSVQKLGHRVDYDFVCGLCNQEVLVENSCDNIVVLLCSHAFHEKCLSSPGNFENCFACLASHSKSVPQITANIST